LWPTSAYTWCYLGFAYSGKKDFGNAELAYRRALDLSERQGQPNLPYLQWVYISLSDNYRHKGDLPAAIANAKRACEIAPRSSLCYNILAYCLVDARQQTAARAEAVESARLARIQLGQNPNHLDALRFLGAAQMMLARYAEAAATFRRALAIQPEDHLSRDFLAETLRWVNSPASLAEAVTVLREGIQIQAKHPEHHYQLSVVARRLGRVDEAVKEAREALRLFPQSASCMNALASALSAQQNEEEAIAIFRQIQSLRPDNHFTPLNMSVSLLRLGRIEEALAMVEAAIKLAPQNLDYRERLGHLRRELGDLPGAMVAYRRRSKLGPDAAKPNIELALAELEKTLLSDDRVPSVLGSGIQKHKSLLSALQGDGGVSSVLGPGMTREVVIDRLTKLYERLEEVVQGKSRPGDVRETLELARLSTFFARRRVLGTRLYAEAFKQDPRLATNPASRDRLWAAESAIVGALWSGVDTPESILHPERKELRKQALAWLRAELADRRVQLQKTPAEAAHARRVLRLMSDSEILRALRELTVKNMLPPAEWNEWQHLLTEIARAQPLATTPGARD
jgi:tetratricopeptide (TPR) repeat protein